MMSLGETLGGPNTGRVSDRYMMAEQESTAHRQRVRYNRTITHAFYLSVVTRIQEKKAREQHESV